MKWGDFREQFFWLSKETSEGYHQHTNGGGWVSDDSTVSDDSRLKENKLLDKCSFLC